LPRFCCGFCRVLPILAGGTCFAILAARLRDSGAAGWSRGKGRTPMKLGFRQGLASAAIFGAVLFTLVSVDDRVRDRFSELVSSGNSLSPWGDRAGDLGGGFAVSVDRKRAPARVRGRRRGPGGLHAQNVIGLQRRRSETPILTQAKAFSLEKSRAVDPRPRA
jgi:hypothetical protein